MIKLLKLHMFFSFCALFLGLMIPTFVSANVAITYHCEAAKLKNGKAKYDNQVIDLTYDQKPPFNQFALAQYSQGVLVNSIADDTKILSINNLAFDRRRYLSELMSLQQQANEILSQEFVAKKLVGQLSFLLSPLTGDVSLSLFYYWKTRLKKNEQHGLYEFAFLPQDKFIQRSERLPFENLGLHAGEYFVQLELQTGFAVNLETSINSAFLGNSFKCRNRLLKEKIQMPPPFEGKVDSFKFLTSKQELISFESYSKPYMELIYESLVHKTSYQKSVPLLKKILKTSQFAQIFKKFQPLNADKKVWVLQQIKTFLVRSRPQQLTQADLAQTTELLTHFEGILFALLD